MMSKMMIKKDKVETNGNGAGDGSVPTSSTRRPTTAGVDRDREVTLLTHGVPVYNQDSLRVRQRLTMYSPLVHHHHQYGNNNNNKEGETDNNRMMVEEKSCSASKILQILEQVESILCDEEYGRW